MSKELVIGSNRHETKVAVLEDDQLVEVYFQRANEYSLAGSIHKGRVTRVLPGMQSAFVDLGLERDTFLYVSDFFEEHEDIDTVVDDVRPLRQERNRGRGADRRGSERSGGDRAGAEIRRQAIAAPLEVQSEELADEGTPVAALRFDEELDLPAAEPGIASVDLSSEPEAALEAGLSSNVAAAGQVSDTNAGDRDRGGDRRHRRRRRRSRGRGFPENKYASPSDSSSPRSFEDRDRHRENRSANEDRQPTVTSDFPATEQSQELEASDVLILPGESLAKYKRSSVVETFTVAEPESVEISEVEELVREAVESGDDEPAFDEEETIEAEAEEIALADRVFAHKEQRSAAEGPAIQDAEENTPGVGNEPPPHELAVPFDEQINVETVVLLENAQPLTTFEASSPFAPPAGDLAVASDDLPDEEVNGGSEPNETIAADAPQSAVLREGNRDSRPLQRSRRMRRRRGGRDRHSGDRHGSEGQTPGQMSIGGAAPALEAEPARRTSADEERGEKPERVYPSIADLLKPGQEIIVQIAKEPLGQKGARITSHVALPGRYVVFMPSVQHLGVSRKIASDEERQRLKRILQAHRTGASGGFIVRTAGEGVPEDEIAADMNFLYNQWLDIRQKAEKKPAPALLHYDLDVVQRILRDQVTEDFKAIWLDNEEMYENVLTFMQRFQPALVNRVKMYTRPAPIFDAFNITAELEKALRPKVWLKSGGYIVINQTEALVAIDINTGKYVGKSNRLEDTIVKTNTEAVKEIVRQIRLRDLGGIIVVDFIDMDERKNRQKVMQALEEAMRADKAPYKILQFNDFGLVAITRKRVKQSLERTLCAPCPYCEGAGYVKSVQTVIGEILIEAQKLSRAIEGKDVLLRVHPEVAKTLKASNNKFLEEIEEILGRPVLVKGDPALHTEKFDLA